eukprot:Gb_31533 [translate_table: standard]
MSPSTPTSNVLAFKTIPPLPTFSSRDLSSKVVSPRPDNHVSFLNTMHHNELPLQKIAWGIFVQDLILIFSGSLVPDVCLLVGSLVDLKRCFSMGASPPVEPFDMQHGGTQLNRSHIQSSDIARFLQVPLRLDATSSSWLHPTKHLLGLKLHPLTLTKVLSASITHPLSMMVVQRLSGIPKEKKSRISIQVLFKLLLIEASDFSHISYIFLFCLVSGIVKWFAILSCSLYKYKWQSIRKWLPWIKPLMESSSISISALVKSGSHTKPKIRALNGQDKCLRKIPLGLFETKTSKDIPSGHQDILVCLALVLRMKNGKCNSNAQYVVFTKRLTLLLSNEATEVLEKMVLIPIPEYLPRCQPFLLSRICTKQSTNNTIPFQSGHKTRVSHYVCLRVSALLGFEPAERVAVARIGLLLVIGRRGGKSPFGFLSPFGFPLVGTGLFLCVAGVYGVWPLINDPDALGYLIWWPLCLLVSLYNPVHCLHGVLFQTLDRCFLQMVWGCRDPISASLITWQDGGNCGSLGPCLLLWSPFLPPCTSNLAVADAFRHLPGSMAVRALTTHFVRQQVLV